LKKKKTSENIITLPTNLINDIKALRLDKTKQSHAFKFVYLVLRDSYMNHENYISYSSKSQKFITKVFDKNYNSWLRSLKEAEIIICDNQYSNGAKKSFYYAINSKYFTGKINYDSILKIDCEAYKDVIKNIDENDSIIGEYLENDLSELYIDYDKLEAISRNMARSISIQDFKVNEQINRNTFELFTYNGTKLGSYYTSKEKAIEKANELGKIIIKSNQKVYMMDEIEFLNAKRASVYTYHMDCINKMNAKKFRFGINTTNNRLDHNLTNMPTELVDEICRDNNLIQLDLSNSQFALLCMLLNTELDTDDFKAFRELAISGQLYESMMNKLGLESRDEAKTAMFELLFSSQSMKSEGKTKLRELYPSVIDWIDQYKTENGYQAFSVMLQLKESEIFVEKLWKTIKEKGLFCLSRHDSLIYKKENQNEIEALVTEYFNEIGLRCNLKLSDSRKIQIAGEMDFNTSTKTDIVYSINELKVMLGDLKNHREYNGVKSAIGMLIDSIDTKTVEEANLHYWHFKNKDYLDMFKKVK
jgi:hypothetical protein